MTTDRMIQDLHDELVVRAVDMRLHRAKAAHAADVKRFGRNHVPPFVFFVTNDEMHALLRWESLWKQGEVTVAEQAGDAGTVFFRNLPITEGVE